MIGLILAVSLATAPYSPQHSLIDRPVSDLRCTRDWDMHFWKQATISCLDASDDWAKEAAQHPRQEVYTVLEAYTRFMLAQTAYKVGQVDVAIGQEVMTYEQTLALYHTTKSAYIQDNCLTLLLDIKAWDTKTFPTINKHTKH